MKIAQVYLFTNRNTLVFDDAGNQVGDIQHQFNWEPTPSYKDYTDQTALRRIIHDNPECYVARGNDRKIKITVEELCCLLGYGPWYWETVNLPKWLTEREKQDSEAEHSGTDQLPPGTNQ